MDTRNDGASKAPGGQPEIGMIVRGSLSEGLMMKLTPELSVESVRAGKFVVVQGERQTFFTMVTDVALGMTDARVAFDPPGRGDDLLRRILQGPHTYGEVTLRPMLMLDAAAAGTEVGPDDLRPVRTIPGHFCPVYDASEADVARIFGSEDAAVAGSLEKASRYFHIGEPLDMDTPVCLNLERFIERSSGIFGKSGTGKTFLTRICLCGILRSKKAVNLIFDMHSEYGWQGTSEGGGGTVRGLKQYFPAQVQMFTLDAVSARRRGIRPDFEVRIPYSQVEPEDILLLAGELNLTPTAAETTYLLQSQFQQRWLETFLAMDSTALGDFAEQHNGNVNSLSALQRRLKMLATVCKAFLVPNLAPEDDAVRAILSRLENDVSVVLEFGTDGKTLPYILVANILTRRIHSAYVRKKEESYGDRTREPKPLVITIEEAHKFLSPALVDQTIFGTIARELRKYNVTLLIVDQRPSGIDDEVLSQVGTRITCLLNDDRDIDAVLTGVSGARELRGILASLDSKQQALILGHAVPMPVVIQTRTYDDEAFRRSMGGFSRAARVGAALNGVTGDDTLADDEAAVAAQRKRAMEMDFA